MQVVTQKGERWWAAGPFVAGVLVGVMFAAALVGGALTALQERGVQVVVETEMIAEQVRSEVRAIARQELPDRLAAMRAEMPKRVGAEMAQRLAETRFDIGGFQVPVPPAVVGQVQSRMEEAIRTGIDMAVHQEDLEAMADRLGDQAHGLVDRRLKESLSGHTFIVKPWPWFSLPVTVVAR